MKQTCGVCGSNKIIHDVFIMDRSDALDKELSVQVMGNPGAFVFKDRLFGQLRAHICGECGHTELRVTNPKALYQKYKDSLK